MKRRIFPFGFMVLALLCTGFIASGVDLDVDYLEGFLEYRQGRDTWNSVDIGDVIPDGSTIRLSDQGFAELSRSGQTVTLTKDGMYETRELFGGSTAGGGRNMRQILGSKFSSLLNRDSSAGMTVAAVRGAEAEGDDFISWEDESNDYLADGKELYESGDYLGAKDLFDEGSIWETGAVQRECLFRYALCQQALGDPRGARATLDRLKPESDDPYLGEYTVTMGALYLESMQFLEADAVLAAYLDTNPRGDAAQAAWLLSALSQESQGMNQRSKMSLRKVVELGPSTDIGQAATAMLD